MASTSSSSMANVLITPEDVLESLMNDGTIDAIRLKIITQLKANEELKNNIITMVEQSKVLNTPGAEKQTKRELFDSLRQELEIPALERASKSVWESILDNDGLGKEINETVEEVFCRLSGREPPLFPPHNAVQQVHVKDKENSRNENENEHLDSSSMNRNFSETSVRMDEGSVDPPSVAVDSVPNSSTVAADCRNNTEAKPKRCNRTDGKNWQCSKDCIPDQRYCERHMSKLKKSCERHMSKLKKPKSLAEGTNQDTSSKHVLRSERLLKRKKLVESTNHGALVNIMVDSSPNICSSMPSPSRVTNTDNNSSNHHRNNASPRLDPSPKSAVKGDSSRPQRLKKRKKPMESTNQGALVNIMVDSSPNICTLTPSPSQVTNADNNSSSHHRNNACPRLDPSPKSVGKGDSSRPQRPQKHKKPVESTNQGVLANIMADSSPNICSSMPSPSQVTNTENNSSSHHRNYASPRLDPSPKSAVKADSSRPRRLQKREKPVESTNQGALVDIMVDSSPNICSSMPSPSQVTNTDNNSSSHHRDNASPRLDPSPKSAVKSDSCERESSL